MTTVISLHEAAQKLIAMTRETRDTGRPFVITEYKKPAATLISTSLFSKMVKLVEKYDPGLADTIAISFNPEIQKLLEQSENDSISGKVVPFDEKLL